MTETPEKPKRIGAVAYREIIEWEGKINAAKLLNPACESEEQANALIRFYVESLLAKGTLAELAAAGHVLWGENMFNVKPQVVRTVLREIHDNQKIIVMGAASEGKCLGLDVGVMMHDGTIKCAEDVIVGDLLMGDDSRPRRVLTTTRGTGQMYRVKDVRTGEFYTCNKDHILTLFCSQGKTNGNGSKNSKFPVGELRDIPIQEFLKKSPYQQDHWSGVRAEINLPSRPVKFDPYIYGLWLGDGGTDLPILHNADQKLLRRWDEYFTSEGYRVNPRSKPGVLCEMHSVNIRPLSGGGDGNNPFKDFVKTSSRCGVKFIRDEYLRNSRSVRLEVLAGILDTDGWLTSDRKGFNIVGKSKPMMEGVVYLARSVGLGATLSRKICRLKDRDFEGIYWSVGICGDCTQIPTVLKIAKNPTSKQYHRCYNPEITEIGEGEYAGFTIDGNHRFLLSDFTITHNSYTGIAWTLLRWWQDPIGTTVKVVSVTGKHTESNIFGTLRILHENTVVPMAGFRGAESIAYTEGDKRACIGIVRIRAGEDNSEVLQGFHPLPRKVKHPIFGSTTAVIAVLDECEGIAAGVWTGTSNMGASGDKDHVKVLAFYNPKDITAKPGQISEPRGGWGEFDVETGVQGKDVWTSREGWRVVRLDAKKTENVQQRKTVFAGFQTYEGFREYETKDGGNSQHLYVFGRGCYPPDSAINTVTPQRVITQMRGEFVFHGPTVKYGGVDTAIDGRDDAVFSVGRYGHATAFKRMVIGADGKRVLQQVTFKTLRKVAQLDQQFALPKGSTEIVAAGIKKHCIALQIAPENFLCDATGNGEPVFILLRSESFWSNKVRGLRFGEDATNLKMLDEDVQTAAQQYDGNVSETLFAITRWGEAGCLAIAPTVNAQELEREIGGRRYTLGAGQTLKVEDKKEYRKRLGRSPDWGDSFSIWLHAIRTGGKVEAAALLPDKPKKDPGLQFDTDDIEKVEWLGAEDVGGF